MRLSKSLIAVAVAAAGFSGSAVAAPAQDALLPGEVNLASDDYGEFLVNAGAGAPGSTVIDPGDILIGALRFNTIEGLSSGTTNVLGAGFDEFTAVFAQRYVGDIITDGVPDPTFGIGPLFGFGTSVFAPITPADIAAGVGTGEISATLAAYLSSWAPGTMVATYSDADLDFSRVGGGTAEDLLDTAGPVSGATGSGVAPDVPLFEVGFTGQPGEFFIADLPSLDLAILGLLPPTSTAASLSAGLNVTANSVGVELVQIECLLTPGGLLNDICVGGNITGVGGATTPYDLIGNIEARFFVVPEPTTTPLVLLGGTMIGLGLAARRRREA